MIDKYLIDIIERMCDISQQEIGQDSSENISWIACREAEKVNNEDFIPQLINFITEQKDKKKRQEAYFLLGHITRNTNNIFSLNFLIQQVGKEIDKYVIATLLSRIANIKKPKGTDLKPLIEGTKNEKWLIRHSAIESLKHTSDANAETTLINIITNSDDPYNLYYANSVLSQIGTMKAIKYLEKHIKSKKRDVKATAKYAIEEIIKRN